MIELLLTAIASRDVAQPVDQQKLRHAAKLPPVSVTPGFGLLFSPTDGFQLSWEKPDFPAEIAAFQKTMRGDATNAERNYRLCQLFGEVEETERARAAFARAVGLEQNTQFLVTSAIHFALTGDVGAARHLLREILEYDRDNEGAQAALQALGEDPGQTELDCNHLGT